MKTQNSTRTDTASLSAGVMGVFISLYMGEGQFDLINVIVSITLILIIIAFVWPGRREPLESIAIACVLSLASVPGIGFLLELLNSGGDLSAVFFPPLPPQTQVVQPNTRVPYWEMSLSWLIVSVVLFMVDRKVQRSRTQAM